MNLVAQLQKEHSVAQANRIARYVGKSARRFSALMSVFMKGPYRITQRASWALTKCVETHPPLITPHLKPLVRKLKEADLHPAVKRNAMRLLQFIDIPTSLQGTLAQIAFTYIRDLREPVAVRVFAMTVLSNMTAKQPELKNELIVIIEDQLPYGTPAFVSRGRKTLKTLRSIANTGQKG